MRLIKVYYIALIVFVTILFFYSNRSTSEMPLEESLPKDQMPNTAIFKSEDVTTSRIPTSVKNKTKRKVQKGYLKNGTEQKAILISLLTVLSNGTEVKNYQRAIDSMRCYAKIHGYNFIIANDKDYTDRCKQEDKFFLRHCIVAIEAQLTDFLVLIDADIGVVNPKRKIEEFIDDRFDITFYDRFFNDEVAMGSYILKNSKAGIDFITEFSNYESKLPNSFHGTDNGAIHAFLISKIFPEREEEYQICLELWKKSRNYPELFVYERCIRSMIGIAEEHGNIRIYRKGTGWVRDNWLTNSLWNPETDFMIHGWKEEERKQNLPSKVTIRMTIDNRYSWYDPLIGHFNFEQCVPWNITWNYDKNLITSADNITEQLSTLRRLIQRETYKDHLALLTKIAHFESRLILVIVVFLLY